MKDWMKEIDWENKSILEIFCEHFNCTLRTINCAMRDSLETIWLRKYYFYKHVEAREGIEAFDWDETFNLEYLADQWYGVNLLKYVPNEGESGGHQETVFRGEGDTPTEALLMLFLNAEELLDEHDIQCIKDIFSTGIEEYNKQYEI